MLLSGNIYLFNVNNRNSKKRCQLWSKLINMVNVKDVFLVFLLFTLNIIHTFFSVYIVDFEQKNVSYDRFQKSLYNKETQLLNNSWVTMEILRALSASIRPRKTILKFKDETVELLVISF